MCVIGTLIKLFSPSGSAGAHLIRLIGNYKYPVTAKLWVSGWRLLIDAENLPQTKLYLSFCYEIPTSFVSLTKLVRIVGVRWQNTGSLIHGYTNIICTIPRSWHHLCIQGLFAEGKLKATKKEKNQTNKNKTNKQNPSQLDFLNKNLWKKSPQDWDEWHNTACIRMTTRISWVKTSGSPSSHGSPSRCKGLIECHLSSSPSVCSADPGAGPSFLSGLSGSWDLRKMNVTQGCLATVCLMCAHKSWQ